MRIPKPGELWITDDDWAKKHGGKRYLVVVRRCPIPIEDKENLYNEEAITMEFAEYSTRRNTHYMQGGIDSITSFLKDTRPATKADWILYASTSWHHFATQERFILED